jgi:hypothetical protein
MPNRFRLGGEWRSAGLNVMYDDDGCDLYTLLLAVVVPVEVTRVTVVVSPPSTACEVASRTSCAGTEIARVEAGLRF